MKNGLWIMTLVLLLATGCAAYGPSPASGYPPGMGVPNVGSPQGYGQEYGPEMDIDYAYNYLAPYGNWVNMDPYGYVWTPRHMGYQWRPYSDGHWVMTDDGWTWIANEEWGSIPFHYGRWGYDDGFGWYWVPGTVWGPAWVSWRWSDQYAGWAPLPPGVEFRAGMDFASLSFNIPSRFWVFIQAPHFLDRDIYRYTLPYERNVTIVNFTSLHNNISYRNNRIFNEGMGIDNVQRVTRQQVPRYKIQDVQKPGPARVVGNDLQIYRPALRTNATAKPKAVLSRNQARQELAPAKVFEPRQQLPVSAQKSAVQKRQAEEKSLLQKTQAQELKDMQSKRAAEQAQIRDTAGKAKIQQAYQAKTAELQKQHQAEKQQLAARQKQDTEQVKRVAQPAKKEKQAPPVKKKKGE
ncbi:MAG: cell envelope integrity protein TolA [Candidatus Aminicenantes bacterium]|nr:cell envelope integrity protein TolA [Candidatus Aminicenantes bacterium]